MDNWLQAKFGKMGLTKQKHVTQKLKGLVKALLLGPVLAINNFNIIDKLRKKI